MSKGYAIKEMMDLTLTPLGDTKATPIVINYCNGGKLSWEEESKAAKKHGKETIFIGNPKTGKFEINAEVVDDDFIALNMGGTKTVEDGLTKIKVSAFSPSTMYKIEGTLNVYVEGGGTQKKHLVCYSAKPQASGEMEFSHEEFTKFSMTFDLSSDANDEFIDYDDVKVGQPLKAPQEVSSPSGVQGTGVVPGVAAKVEK